MKWLAYLLCLVLLLLFAADALAVTIPTVPVGNAGNAADTEVMLDGTTGYGSVAYDYRVGRYEVTNAQYAEFLNAKAASDPLSLYSGFMGSLGGITRSGISGSYTYATITGWGDKPVNFVNWYDSIRFANWLNNGQGTGDTETGAYTLLGGTPFPSNGLSITRNAAATWFLPSENEWYKAAYYDPTSSSYFDFPTASNAVPIAEPPPGGGNSANYDVNGAFLTDVGAYSGSESPYGTSDQGGNVSEWNDALIRGSSRGWRGGYYSNNSFLLRSKARIDADPTDEYFYNGFRVATIPEPSTFALAALGMLGIVLRRWSRPMPMHRTMCHLCIWSALACYAGSANLATAGPLVYVGNPGNPPDQNYGGNGQFGAVPDGYRISIHEVTNAEYAVFLNANVSIRQGSLFLPPIFGDPASLLNSSMLDDPRGGMEIYSPACVGFLCGGGLGHSPPPPPPRFRGTASMYNKPVNFVSWYDAARYVNWLHNGQGSGSTETGAYALGPLGNGGVPLDPAAITRNPGATWFLPNENEWYKAAYYQPAAAGGDSDGYWLSPTRSNATTAIFATSDSAGNISNPGADVMNESGATWNGQTGNVTTVGSAGPLSASFYGTFDQGGNVAEWTETWAASGFVTRGGSWNAGLDIGFRADQRTILPPTYEAADLGFRIAQVVWIVPEPSTFALVAVGILGLIVSRKCRRSIGSTVVLLALAVCAADARAVTIPTVPVGNPGNANGTIGFGAVSYDYRIGTTEVTNDQYAEFLNAKAASDPLALYNGNMGSDPRGGIAQSGVDGSFTYAARTDMGNKPVNFVSWYDSIRFANWLNNGQGSGGTEKGAYTLGALNPDGTPTNGLSITRNAGATWFLTSENEWFKAAYHQPAAQGGDLDSYWAYPTRTNTAPNSDQPPGALSIQSNVANFYRNDGLANGYNDGYAITGSTSFSSTLNYLSDVGAYAQSGSFYGTFDQAGNVWEWNEALISTVNGLARGARGGGWERDLVALSAPAGNYGIVSAEVDFIGFRVATVPEPSGFILAAFGLIGLAVCCWRRKGR